MTGVIAGYHGRGDNWPLTYHDRDDGWPLTYHDRGSLGVEVVQQHSPYAGHLSTRVAVVDFAQHLNTQGGREA